MVYVEYNTSKKQYVESVIDEVIESDTHEGYELLPFAPFKTTIPSNTTFALKDLTNEDDEDYLLRFKPVKTYPFGSYYFEYNDKYYLFETSLRYGTTLYFRIEEYIDVHDVTHYMPTILVKGYYQSKEILPVYDVLELNKSGSEMTFSTIKADFGIRGMQQLPMAFQEIRIWKGDLLNGDDLSRCELIFTGFLDKAELTQKHKDDDECDIELTLLSPKNIATKRYVSINGSYETNELFDIVFEPLIRDGFELSDINVDSKTIAVNYYLESIETIMNDLSNKLNIYWTIDSKKNIHITDIIKLLGQEPKIIIDNNNNLEGNYELKPTIENNNYFNCINVKNARLFTTANDAEVLEVMKLVRNSTHEFVNPIDFSLNSAIRVCQNNNTYSCSLLTIYGEDGELLYDISYDIGDRSIVLPEGVVWSDGDTEEADMILKRDSFFKNLVTGIEWKGQTQFVDSITTDTMLKYELFRFTNSNEIYKCSQFLTDSGIIETTIDVNESWFTYTELVEYCNNLMISNSNNTSSVEISVDKNYDLDVGDTIRINKPNFFINGDFVITEMNETMSGYDSYDCHVVAQNNKLQNNYIDVFRKQMSEENEAKYDKTNIIEFISEEVVENYNVYQD